MLNIYMIAQSINEITPEISEEEKLLAKITIYKILQGLSSLLIAYLIIKIIDSVIIWISERIAKGWRLRVKQFLPFLRMVVLGTTTAILINLFFNLSQENIIAITGTVAVALGFAFKDYASSIIAGIVGLFEVTYQVGDRLRVKDYHGEVVNYGLRAIRLQTPDDNLVTIPHNIIWTEGVANSNAGKLEAQVITKFYCAPESDVDLVKKILYRAVYTSKYTHLKLPIVVLVEEKPWGILFRVKSYPLDARDEFIYQTDLTTRVKRAFAKYQIAYPSFFFPETKDEDS